MKHKRITRTEEEWNRLIQQCQDRGKTMKAWCEEHGISVATFYNRLSRTKNKSGIHARPILDVEAIEEQNVVPISIIDTDSCTEDHVPSSGYEPAVTLTIGRCHAVIHNHADRETVRNTLYALQQIC